MKASIERTTEIGGGAAYIWGSVKKIETPDPTTVTSTKYSAPLDLVASASYAAYIFDTQAAGDQDLAKWFAEGNEAGTGPYMLDTWDEGADVELRLKAYPDYWGAWDETHYENVIYRVVPEATTTAQLLRSGQVTWVERLNPQLWATFQDDPNTTTTSTPSWQTLLAMLNTADGPLADQKVRQAVMAGIDYEGMMQALQGGAEPLSGVVPPGLWGHVDDLFPTQDIDTATSLLGDAGYGPGGDPMDLELTYVTGDSDEQTVATLMKSNLADLNVNVDARGMQWTAQWAKGKSANVEERQDISSSTGGPTTLIRHRGSPTCSTPRTLRSSTCRTTRTRRSTRRWRRRRSWRRPTGRPRRRCSRTCRSRCSRTPSISLYTQTYQRAMLGTFGGYVDNPAYANVVFAYDLTPGAA